VLSAGAHVNKVSILHNVLTYCAYAVRLSSWIAWLSCECVRDENMIFGTPAQPRRQNLVKTSKHDTTLPSHVCKSRSWVLKCSLSTASAKKAKYLTAE